MRRGQSLKRARKSNQGKVVARVTPKMQMYITDKCRLMNGIEAALVQGLHFGPPVV